MKISNQIHQLEKKLASSLKKSDIKILINFEGTTGNFKEVVEPEDLSIDTILSLVDKHYSKKLENFDVRGKPYVGTNGDFVELFIKCNWKDESDEAQVVVKIRFDKMFDKIISVLS